MKLTVDRLHVTLDRNPILRDVSFEARKGDIVGLVGPNGSGKSTLLRTVYRSLRPADGVVRVGEDDVWELSPRAAARRTAAVLQDAGGNTTGLTVAEIVALGRAPLPFSWPRNGALGPRVRYGCLPPVARMTWGVLPPGLGAPLDRW